MQMNPKQGRLAGIHGSFFRPIPGKKGEYFACHGPGFPSGAGFPGPVCAKKHPPAQDAFGFPPLFYNRITKIID
jgi:hypothetical protein